MPLNIDWRNLVSTRDIGDIIGLVTSTRRILARRSQQTADQIGRDVRRAEGHIMDDVMTMMQHTRSIVDRKSRELSRTRKETAKRVNKEVQHGVEEIETSAEHLREGVQASAQRVRDAVDQKSYEVAKQVVVRHEQRKQEDGSFGLFFVGALVGTLVGAVIAIWYAPQSGEQTRHEIEHSAAETRRRIEGESAEDAIRAAKEEVRRLQQTPGAR